MKNVDMKVEGHILTIRVDLNQDYGPSSSGKTIMVASTLGNKAVSRTYPDIRVGLNVYKKIESSDKKD